METVKVLDWVLEVDRDATVEAYKKLPVLWPDACSCLYCHNYFAAVDRLPLGFVELCAVLGTEPPKPVEVVQLCKMESAGPPVHLYEGWHHVVGRLLSRQDTDGTNQPYVELCEGVSIAFSEVANLPEEWFPRPILELRFFAEIAWVLEELP